MEAVVADNRLALVMADLIRNHKESLQNKYHVSSLALFGSYVRGDQTPESDVDILVDFVEPGVGFFKFMELERVLSNIIARKVDLVSRGGIKPLVYEHIKDSLLYI
ncbi:MAG: nucleotidyltransferase family protein [Bacteroidota bacterium]